MNGHTQILWVYDDFDGPMTGLLQYNDENLWFNRVIELSDIINTNDNNSENVVRKYNLMRLNSDFLKEIKIDHEEYCKQTGAPLNHGDPRIIKKRPQITKYDYEKINQNGEDMEATFRSLMNVKLIEHKYNTMNICGEFVATINESDIINYFVPHPIKIE